MVMTIISKIRNFGASIKTFWVTDYKMRDVFARLIPQEISSLELHGHEIVRDSSMQKLMKRGPYSYVLAVHPETCKVLEKEGVTEFRQSQFVTDQGEMGILFLGRKEVKA